MFKKLTLLLAVVMIALTATAFAQNPTPTPDERTKNSIGFNAIYVRENTTLTPQGAAFEYRENSDSIGFEVQYLRRVVGPLNIGMEAGVTFHSKDRSGVRSCGPNCTVTSSGTSKVAKAYFGYVMQLEKQSGSVRPWVKGVVRVKRNSFGGIVFANDLGFIDVSGGNQFEAGGGAGVLIRAKGNTFFNAGFTATRAINRDSASWDLQPSLGFVVKFGKK